MKRKERGTMIGAAAVAIGAVFGVLLCGCGSGKKDPDVETATSQTGRATLTIAWPARDLSRTTKSRLIPSATDYLEVYAEKLVGNTTRTYRFAPFYRPAGDAPVSQTVYLDNLPLGIVTVHVLARTAAKNADGTPSSPLALGTVEIGVEAGQVTQSAVTLAAALDRLEVELVGQTTDANRSNVSGNTASPIEADRNEIVELVAAPRAADHSLLLLAPDALEWSLTKAEDDSTRLSVSATGPDGPFGTGPVRGDTIWVKGTARSLTRAGESLFVRETESGKQSDGVFVHVHEPRYQIARFPDGFLPQSVRVNGDVAGTMGSDTGAPLVLYHAGQIVPDDAPAGARIVAQNRRNQEVLLRPETVNGVTMDVPYFWDNGVETRIGWVKNDARVERVIVGLSDTGTVLGRERKGTSGSAFFPPTTSWLWRQGGGFTSFGADEAGYVAIAINGADQVFVDQPVPLLGPVHTSAEYYVWQNGNLNFFASGSAYGLVTGFGGDTRLVGTDTFSASKFVVWDTATLKSSPLVLPTDYSGNSLVESGAYAPLAVVSATRPATAGGVSTVVPVIFAPNETVGIDLNDVISHRSGVVLSQVFLTGLNGSLVASTTNDTPPTAPFYLLTPLP